LLCSEVIEFNINHTIIEITYHTKHWDYAHMDDEWGRLLGTLFVCPFNA